MLLPGIKLNAVLTVPMPSVPLENLLQLQAEPPMPKPITNLLLSPI